MMLVVINIMLILDKVCHLIRHPATDLLNPVQSFFVIINKWGEQLCSCHKKLKTNNYLTLLFYHYSEKTLPLRRYIYTIQDIASYLR